MDPTDICNNEKKWKNFLSSIGTGTFKYLPTNNLKITTKHNICCLATEFADKLELKANAMIEDPHMAANFLHVPYDVEIHPFEYHHGHNPSKKDGIAKSCSKWNISNIAEYFNFDDCVTKIEMPEQFSLERYPIYEKVQTDIYRQIERVRGIDMDEIKCDSYSPISRRLISITTIETGSRLVLDALLVPLCSALDLEFEVEKNINCDFLPNCRFDYCIRKGEHIIGCIEAKSVKSLSDTSIAQAVVELMILQTTLLRTKTPEVDISELPVFAIVTDGHRFIYIQLKGLFLGFEHNGDKVRIREVGQECDFKDILQHISCLVDGAVGYPINAHLY